MKPHAVVAESPIVARSGIALSHDAVDAECLQSCSQSSSAVQVSQFDSSMDKSCSKSTHAFPPPIMKTSVSKLGPSNCLAGA